MNTGKRRSRPEGPEQSAGVLGRLHAEHRNIARLLGALEYQLAIFDRGERPDYDVLAAAADYFTEFPDRCHHPKEDLVFRAIERKDPEAARSIGDLEREHERIAELAGHFREAVRNVLDEVEVPRQAFDAVLRHFIRDQRRHMEMEEERFFPLAQRVLGPEDWAEIERLASREDDPLFGAQVSQPFEALLRTILTWEREDEASAP